MDTSIDTLDIKGKWELEANTIIADDEWESSWMSWHKCLSSPTWREFSWKLRMRYFKTPLVIAKYDKKYSPLCWRGCGLIGDFSHIFWDCPKLQKFWEEVKREISEILNLDSSIDPQQLILGTTPSRGLGKNELYMIRVMMLIAHKMITVNWLRPHPPTVDQWAQRLQAVNCMESLTASLRLRMDIYLAKWTPVIMYLLKWTFCWHLTGQAGLNMKLCEFIGITLLSGLSNETEANGRINKTSRSVGVYSPI